ncbi:DUF4865 family protein (plasmid) [Agrobacterium vitis]|uniref:DUF4865 family protein n=1 Tax=Agrobacterium vitis TaxID=373 RepID=UPI0012E93E3F|nr:DUF4865 family protein [Agrobacterium vitis]MVA27416.1 DUF4865 family protein [Agrobacterium vitis]
MIAMQYSFTLPADYDMAIIERRIRDKGPLLDGFPRLRFKAYLYARKQGVGFTSRENLYAPFYLWNEPKGIDGFLSSPGFAGLARDFGWPSIQTWLVWHAQTASDLTGVRFATREIRQITAYSDLASQRDAATAEAQSAVRSGALAAVAAFDPTNWRLEHFCLWSTMPVIAETRQVYYVGHISLP